MHPLFFTTPVSKVAYLGGRFSGALLVNAFILLSIPLGLMLGSVMPYLDRASLRRVSADGVPATRICVLVLPNLIFTGAIFFALAALTRQMMPNYMGGAMMLVGYLLAGNLARDIENERLAALLDPFGLNAFQFVTKYWTPAERNATLVGLQRRLSLQPRCSGWRVGLAIFARRLLAVPVFACARASRRWRRRNGGRQRRVTRSPYAAPRRLQLPRRIARSFTLGAQVQQYLSLARAVVLEHRRQPLLLRDRRLRSAVPRLQRQSGRQDVRHDDLAGHLRSRGGARRHVCDLHADRHHLLRRRSGLARARRADQPGAGRDAGAQLGAVCGEVHGARADGRGAAGRDSRAGVADAGRQGLHELRARPVRHVALRSCSSPTTCCWWRW